MTAITTEAPIATIRPKMGFTLIEVLICLSMLAAMSAIAVSLYGQQIAHSQLNEVSHAFIQDAHLARQLSRQMDKTITLKPLGLPNLGIGLMAGQLFRVHFLLRSLYKYSSNILYKEAS